MKIFDHRISKKALQRKLYKAASMIRMGAVATLAGYLVRGWYQGHVDATWAGIGGVIVLVIAGVCDFLEG